MFLFICPRENNNICQGPFGARYKGFREEKLRKFWHFSIAHFTREQWTSSIASVASIFLFLAQSCMLTTLNLLFV